MNDGFDLAVIGMAGRFPGARDIDEFWRNLANGVESISQLSDEEMLAAGVPAAHLAAAGYVKAAPVLDQPGHFDAAFFGYSPMEARNMDPQQRLLLELAYEALEHSGYAGDRDRGRVGVFTGSAMNTYFASAGLNRRLADDYIPTLIGNDKDFLSTRLSYKLDLKGPSVTVQSACSTSLVAVHLACQSLLAEEIDMAVVGAVSVRVPHRAGYFCDPGGVVSAEGHVRAFDAKANGTVFGSGGGIVVLKRLRDAIAGRDTIHAVIKGSAVNNDGCAKAGYTAPSIDGQAEAVAEALANAGVAADTIGYVEAHGSGTPIGDPIEVRALTKAFRGSTQRRGYCAIGSVKTNVGHLDAAAGVTGMIKAILALKHRQIPPSLHFNEPNPEIDFPSTPFYVNSLLQEWKSALPRRAGVMSTGMGGTNAHIILEEAPAEPVASRDHPPHLLVLSARTESALDAGALRLSRFLESEERVSLGDVAYTLQSGRKAFAHRRYMVCSDRHDAIRMLAERDPRRIASGRAGEPRRPVVLLLPGIGDHYVGMGRGLYNSWPVFREEIDRCAAILLPYLDVDIRSLIYPSGSAHAPASTRGIDLRKMLAGSRDGAKDPEAAKLERTLFAQPALFSVEYATARLWQALGVVPDGIVGHSMGEYVAACIAGVLSLEDALRLVATRARLVDELPVGAMLAVALSEQDLLPLLPEDVSISLINGPRLCIVAGPPSCVARFEQEMQQRRVICRSVRNAHAFHSRMLDPIVGRFEAEARKVRFNEPAIPYISNVTGTWVRAAEACNPAYWARHAVRPARFSDALQALWKFTNPILLEAGPGKTLGVLATQHPDRGEATPISSIRHEYENEPDVDFLWRAVGRMWTAGIPINWDKTSSAGRYRRIPLPTYPFERRLHWIEPVAAIDVPATTRGALSKNPNPADWLYIPSWKRSLPRAFGLGAASSKRRCLVLADDSTFASALIAQLGAIGNDIVVVRPGVTYEKLDGQEFTIRSSNLQDYLSLIEDLQKKSWLPETIIHAWNASTEPRTGGDWQRLVAAQGIGFYSLAFLARALAARNVRDEIALFVLAHGIQAVGSDDGLSPESATLLGPCMVMRQEYPNLRVKCIDLDPQPLRTDAQRAAAMVVGEMIHPDTTFLVAHRKRERWVHTYEPFSAPSSASVEPVLRNGGVYLITGGLGAVGTTIAEHLAQKYAARLALIGRSALPARSSWDSCLAGPGANDSIRLKIETIRRIEKLGGKVLYIAADAADSTGMVAAIEETIRQFGALHGVIHGAGVVGSSGYREIKDSDPIRCEEQFRAKAGGALALASALDGRTLDFCLLLSSLTSVLGGIGQAAYASANLYLDAFAWLRNRSSSSPWLSVNWDVWRPGANASGDAGPGGTLRELGMSAAEATAMLETVLAARNAGQLIVSTGDLGARIAQWVQLESLDAGPTEKAAPSLSRSAEDAPEALRDETEQQVARIWEAALGIEAIGSSDSFADLGGHSLLAIRVVAELRKAFQIDLGVRALFDAPTVAELSRHIRAQIAAEVDSLTEEQAQSLASVQ